MAASTSTAMELPQDNCAAIDATPLPLPMRKKPQRRWGIGAGKHYASVAAFNAALAEWDAEHTARATLLAQRRAESERQREKKRSRDSRDSKTRNEDAALKAARALRAAARRHPMPLIQRNEFQKLALLHKNVRAANRDQNRVLFPQLRLQWQHMLQRGAQRNASYCSSIVR